MRFVAIAAKRLAAIALLAALFLPLSRCTLEEHDPQTKATKQTVSVTYAYSGHSWPSVDALADYAAFLWPLLLAVARMIRPGLNQRWSVQLLELALCLGSAFILFRLTIGGEWLYGAYIAAAAIAAYFTTVLAELAARLRRAWIRAPTPI